MRLKSLKLAGFKSFVDPIQIEFPGIMCGIVGPNGCGKSNIVEAIKWNMGEAGPSRLRAGEMNDLIFSGTKGRASRNSAEVIVTIKNSDNSIQSYENEDEIEVSRKIERDIGSTYTINNKGVRQRDVQILFADLAIGSRSNAIVDQGQVSRIINSKPQERRQILEEAAGISGIHARKHETELKLKSTETNLEKLEEIISNDKLRLKELSRQTNQAKKYKNIDDLNKSWGNVFWSMEYRSFSEVELPNLTVTEANPSHNFDFRKFSSDQVKNFNSQQVKIINEHSGELILSNNKKEGITIMISLPIKL